MPRPELTLRPIGVVRTPHTTKYGAPRQPGSANERTIGVIELDEGRNFEQALDDLQGFDYVWVIFWFHENKNWKPKVLPPHGGRMKRGLFSTRSPHRPNPIGLSLCKLLGIRGRTIRIENPDMLDGTPILDIKPYLPHAESLPDARGGWIEKSNEKSKPAFRVTFTAEVKKVLNGLEPNERREITTYLTDVLSHDPHPHVYRRIKKMDASSYVIAVKRWRFMFEIEASSVRVFAVAHDRDRGARS